MEQEEQKEQKSYKIVLVGDSGCGKTTYLKRFTSGEYETMHFPTRKIKPQQINIYTNVGPFSLEVLDCPGDFLFSKSNAQYYENADIFIIFYVYRETVVKHYHQIKEMCPLASILIYRTKGGDLSVDEETDCYTISSLNNLNLEKPFLNAIQNIKKDLTIRMVEAPPIRIPSI
jgi:GTP-binding nuclear protein Ran